MISSIASRPYSVKSYRRQTQIRRALTEGAPVRLCSEEQPADAVGRPPVRSGRGCRPGRKRRIIWTPMLDLNVVKEQGSSRYLYGAGHGAEGEHGGAVFDGGLAVKRSLSVHQQHGHLMGGDASPTSRPLTRVNTVCYSCQPCCHQASPPQRLRSRPGFRWSPSHSPPSR